MVKADAYNHGVNKVAPFTESMVDRFGVATVKEGMWLRKLGITKPISVFNYLSHECKKVIDYSLTPVAYNFDTLRSILSGEIKDFDLKIDSGMNRFGFKSIDEVETLQKLLRSSNVMPRVIHTHFAGEESISKQIKRFEELVKPLAHLGLPRCASATNGIKRGYYMDGVRAGLIAYEGGLKATSEIIVVKNVLKGERIGYDYEYTAKADEKIAVICGGYYDGIMRAYSGACVTVNGSTCPIIGKVSMDTAIIKLNTDAVVGDRVTIWDKDTINDFANSANVTVYEVITSIKGRCERKYYHGQTRDKTTC